MGRIEDDEAERAERLRQDRKLQEQQVQKKNLAEHEQFQAFVRKAGETQKQETRQDQHKQEGQTDARNAVLARRGIASNKDGEQFLAKSQASNAKTRSELNDRALGRERQPQGNPLLQGQHKSDTKATGFGVGRGGDKQSEQEGNKDPKKNKGDAERSGPVAASAQFASIGQAAVQALDGLGAKAGNTSGVSQAEQIRKMLQEIVAAVRQGVDSHGHELMEIELNDDVLGGTKLTVLSTPAGVHLKIDTNEQGTRQSDRPIESLLTSSATELAAAMKGAKVPLIGLEVNGDKVIA